MADFKIELLKYSSPNQTQINESMKHVDGSTTKMDKQPGGVNLCETMMMA